MKASRHHPDPPQDAWSAKDLATAGFVVLFLALQSGLILWQFTKPRPAPFGWQMYSAVPERHTFTVRSPDGIDREVDPEGILGKVRGELDLQRLLPPHLCAAFPGSKSVLVVDSEGKLRREHPCP